MADQWVFGYGSLVSPRSFGHTIRRELTPGIDFLEAEIAGYGRRWNYGTAYEFTAIDDLDPSPKRWTFVALGVVRSSSEATNGVIARVDDAELAALDGRERNYDRVDVTEHAVVHEHVRRAVGGAAIVTYVPRPGSIERYERARAAGVAAITLRYWELVDGAFADLGADHRARYHATTPAPGIPIIEQPAHEVPDRHRGATIDAAAPSDRTDVR